MLPQKKALLIINRASRNGEIEPGDGIRFLEANGIDVIMHYPENSSEMNALINKYHNIIDLVIIGGGDGTLNHAARGILGKQTPLGILPLGTANDLARTLDIPNDFIGALNVVVKGRLREIDLGCVNGIPFFNAASIGLGSHVTRNLSKCVKSKWGALGYAHGAWSALKTNRSFRAKIVCDDMVIHTRSIQIAVGNGRFYGGGMAIKNDATISDQRLDLYSIKPQKIWNLLSLVPAVRTGQFDNREYVEVLHGRKIEVFTRKRKSISTDGELTTYTPGTFQVIPRAVQVFVS